MKCFFDFIPFRLFRFHGVRTLRDERDEEIKLIAKKRFSPEEKGSL